MSSEWFRANSAPLLGAVATGMCLVLAAPPWNLSWLGWFAFWPLLRVLPGRRAIMQFGLGTVAGTVWSLGTAAPWLYPAARLHLAAGVAGATLLTVLATWVWGGLYLALLAVIYCGLPRPRWLAMPAAWVIGEAMRSHSFGGAPWSLLGHSQHDVFLLRQLAELTGVGGLSFLVAMPSAALAETGRQRWIGMATAAVLVAAAIGFGATREPVPLVPGMPLQIRILSGASGTPDGVARYAEQTRAQHADLTVWPEAATPGYLQEEPAISALVAGAARAGGWLLTGAHRYDGRGDGRRYFNAAAFVNPQGEVVASRAKRHLVPFAERRVLGWPQPLRPFTPGAPFQRPLITGALQVAPLICWDVLFAEVARGFVAQGADLLANLSSDADLAGAVPQLLASARFRAIETRRWLVRASGAGQSVAIDPFGRIVQTDVLALPRAVVLPTTFYVRYGEILPWLAALLLALLSILRDRERRGSVHPEP